MTDAEDTANAEANDRILACRHDPATNDSGGIYCRLCGCRFAVLLLARRATFYPIDFDDDEE